MGKVRARKENEKLYFDFFYQGVRCREQTELLDTPANRKRLQAVLSRIEGAIEAGTFVYESFFPKSRVAQKLANATLPLPPEQATAPTFISFEGFARTWFAENEVRWRRTTRGLRQAMLEGHLLAQFGALPISGISRAAVLEFRALLAKKRGKVPGSVISPKTVNEIVALLLNILAEAADRYGFQDPTLRIKRLKVPRKDIQPFTIEEAMMIINAAREDYKDYFVVRFFTGMRSGEIHGLKWRCVDLERRQILVRESFTHGAQDGTKTDGSVREVEMNRLVLEALKRQRALTAHLGEYVFCGRAGQPIESANFVNRVWYPLLRHLSLASRRPYQMRHTAATLWLAAGESPEWIARQLGHTTTEMLFRVYSRYVPNLTRRDGSAFERLLEGKLLELRSEKPVL